MLAHFALALALPSTLFDVPTLRGAQVGIYAVWAGEGGEIFARDPDAAMVPASNLKLVVGSAALSLLGPAFAFTTTVCADGSTVYLRSDGDPLLNAGDLADAAGAVAHSADRYAWFAADASAVQNANRYPDGWQQDDLPYDYAAPPSALSYDENSIHVHVAPAAVASDHALVTVPEPHAPLTVDDRVTTGPPNSDDTVTASIVWDERDTIRISGSIPAGSAPDDFGISVLDPSVYTMHAFGSALATAGVTGIAYQPNPDVPVHPTVLWTHHSQALPDLLRSMWQPSDNLLAESLLDALGGSRVAGLAKERDWLRSIGVDPATVTLADGSGLSAYDRITARDLVTILQYDWNGPNRASVLAALPVAGKSGTLQDAFAGTPLAGDVIAKTGTVNHARTLSGYLQTARGTIVFSLLVNGWMDVTPQADANMRNFQASVLEALANE